MSNALDIKLLDKDYRVACDPAEHDSLMAAVAFLDGRLTDIAAKTKSKGERLAMMAALNLAHEFLALKNIPSSEAAALESASLLATIKAIESKIDASLADHGHTD